MSFKKALEDSETVRQLLSDIGISQDLFLGLNQDDDWSFIIKLHALLEIAISHLLAERLGKQLNDIFTNLDMNNKNYGKMKFVKELSLMEKETLLFIDLLGEMRNAFAHDIRMTSGGIKQYLLQLKGDAKKRDRYNKWMQLWMSDKYSEEVVLELIRFLTLSQAMKVLIEIYFAKEKADLHRRKDAVNFFFDVVRNMKPSE